MISRDAFETTCLDLEIGQIERKIASWTRELSLPSEKEPINLENTLLRLQLEFAALNPDDTFVPDGSQDLAANLLARSLGNIAPQSNIDAAFLCSLSAASFAAAGNFATASVFARKSLEDQALTGDFELWCLRLLARPTLKFSEYAPVPFRKYAFLMDEALDSGMASTFQEARAELMSSFKAETNHLSIHAKCLALMWEKIHDRYAEMSAARNLREHGLVHLDYFKQLRLTASATLFPTQMKALREHALLRSSTNSLILLPTSTGKSLLGELVLLKSVLHAGSKGQKPLAVYLAPYRALADQLARRMKPRLDAIGVNCEVLRGGYLFSGLSKIRNERATILVATPEAFDSLVRARPELYEQIACCVFDEFHLIEQNVRGLSYEGLAARFLSNPPGQQPRIVALSPVITKADNLIDWLNIPAHGVVSSDWRPTGRRLAVAGPDRQIRYYTPGEQLNTQKDAQGPAWFGATQFPHLIDKAPAKDEYHKFRDHEANIKNNIAVVAVEQYRKFKSPVLVIATSRADTRRIAALIAKEFNNNSGSGQATELASAIIKRHPDLRTLHSCLMSGVAYHNASLPDWVRELLEKSIEDGHLRVVVSTTTLAEGVDLPFRIVVLSGWRSYQFGSVAPIPSLLFRNIAGRCGRAGAFAEGDTIIVDNPHRTDLNYRERLAEYERLYIKPQQIELQPAPVRAITTNNASALMELRAGLDSQFTAFLNASPPQVEHVESFVANLLSSRSEDARPQLHLALTEIVEEALAESEYPVLRRNSPLQLTEFGRKILPSGLSGRSASRLAQFYASYSPGKEPTKGRKRRTTLGADWDPLIDALSRRLMEGSFVDELETGDYKLIDERGYPIKSDTFPDVIMAWMSGCSITEIALVLEKDKEKRASAEKWLRGDPNINSDGFEEDLEKLSVFCSSYLSHQWSWILRGSVLILNHLDLLDLAQNLSLLGRRIAVGAGDILAAHLLEQRCPVDRSIVCHVTSRYLTGANAPQLQDLADLGAWIGSNMDALVGTRIGAFQLKSIEAEDLQQISAFTGR